MQRELLALILTATLATAGCGLLEPRVGLACQQPPAPETLVGDRGVPDVQGKTPERAAATLTEAGMEASWRYSYRTEPNGTVGYSECWCVPPPDGTVEQTTISEDGQLIVFVRRAAPILGGRPQPVTGWGCPEEPSTTESPGQSATAL